MNAYIKKRAEQCIRKYDTRNPFVIADMLNVQVFYADLGRVSGYYQYLKRHRCIYINTGLSDSDARIVMAHELGHAILHRTENCCFMENKTLLLTSRIEIEANQFAAELLIPDNLIYRPEYEGFSARQIAYVEGLNEELLRLKFDNK